VKTPEKVKKHIMFINTKDETSSFVTTESHKPSANDFYIFIFEGFKK